MGNLFWAILQFALGGLNTWLAVGHFQDGSIGMGVFSATVAVWCLVVGIFNLKGAYNEY
jgi:hypothetical protein